jgi:EAL domain-containing protein (putative c-di-GMP-specific phosphodiesterase class I)
VENAETRQRLTALGCDFIQGYFVSRPMPADQTAEWIGRKTVPPLPTDRTVATLAD